MTRENSVEEREREVGRERTLKEREREALVEREDVEVVEGKNGQGKSRWGRGRARLKRERERWEQGSRRCRRG